MDFVKYLRGNSICPCCGSVCGSRIRIFTALFFKIRCKFCNDPLSISWVWRENYLAINLLSFFIAGSYSVIHKSYVPYIYFLVALLLSTIFIYIFAKPITFASKKKIDFFHLVALVIFIIVVFLFFLE